MNAKLIIVVLAAFFICLASAKEDRLEELEAMTQSSPLIHITNQAFVDKYVLTARRYSFLLVFSSLSASCGPCKPTEEALQSLAETYVSELRQNETLRSGERVFFALAHFSDDNKAFFQKFSIAGVPYIVFLPKVGAKEKSNPPFKQMTLTELPSPRKLAAFVNEQTGLEIPVAQTTQEALNEIATTVLEILAPYTKFAWFATMGIAFIIILRSSSVLYKNWRNPMFYFWICIATIFIVYAGTVWNFIHSPPPFVINPYTNQIMFFARSSRSQYWVEGLIMAVTILSVSAAFIYLNEIVAKSDVILASPSRQHVSFWALLIGFLFSFNLLIKFFVAKNPHYPYPWYLI